MKRKQAAYSEVITEALGTKQDSTNNTFAFSLRFNTPCPPEKGLCRGGPCAVAHMFSGVNYKRIKLRMDKYLVVEIFAWWFGTAHFRGGCCLNIPPHVDISDDHPS